MGVIVCSVGVTWVLPSSVRDTLSGWSGFKLGKKRRKVKRSKSHIHEHCYTKDGKPTDDHSDGLRFSENDSSVTVIHAHPRHGRQMKPHQVEGFNFLVSNLVADDPGGCILANAPGSGKTFMIISFMQSFLTKHPEVRSLVVLPKSILATWKKEFLTWQVEDIPLYDFYSVKADRPSQQLDVLKQWVVEKSILFLGHTQFTAIVSGDGASEAELTCQELIMSKMDIMSVRNQMKSSHADAFYSVVETTLQKDDNFWRKITLIQDLRELPGLFEFTVLLDLSSRQKQEIENLKVYERVSSREIVLGVLFMYTHS
ncbi:Protein chromatin remodeling 35 [Vitis vinifera]|uniref:Protein chromatin remodeling 35 n=1 Tax=Vitis vinifera TaxID=29760 RepID=A0A438JTC0_VITVI|nr:Protein chromatin remodeling 35 [Vitis vinifera]